MIKAYADIPEGQVHYRTEGSGKPLLLLHQTPFSSEEYSLMIPVLAKGYRVVAMDTIGYGDSDNPPHEYEIADYARSVVSFLDALEIKKTSIVSHHTGSSIAVEIAAAYPERVEKLILSGCPALDLQEWEPLLSAIGYHSGREITEDGQFLVNSWNLLRSLSPQSKPEFLLKLAALSLDGRTRPYDAHPAVEHYDIKPRLRLIKSPTLLISGSRDFFLERLEATKNLIPRCKTQIIDSGGALMCLEKPDEFAQVILDFLKNPGV